MPDAQREQLILTIFTGRYNNEIVTAERFRNVLASLIARAFGREMK